MFEQPRWLKERLDEACSTLGLFAMRPPPLTPWGEKRVAAVCEKHRCVRKSCKRVNNGENYRLMFCDFMK